jgi:SAM-dependent methyltransferase
MGRDELRSTYDRVAGAYEHNFADELQDKPWDRQVLAAFCAAVADPVVEVGCGPGQVGAYIQRGGRLVIGLDISVRMARLAAGRLRGSAVADMRCLPIADGSTGGLLAFYSIIHLQRGELGDAFREFRRVLKPGGRVLLSAHEGEGELHRDEFLGERVPFVATLFNLGELETAARGAGLEVAWAERRPPYPAEHPTVRLYIEAVRAA